MNEEVNLDKKEPVKSNLGKRVIFPTSLGKDRKEAELERLSNLTSSHENLIKEDLLEKMALSLEEKRVIEDYLNIAKGRLLALGIEDAKELLPTLDQIVIIRHSKESLRMGFVTEDSTLLVVFIKKGESVTDEHVKQTFFHEVSHFITQTVLKSKIDGNLELAQFGFNRNFMKPNEVHEMYVFHKKVESAPKENHYFSKGIYEESSADLFALYCIDDKDEVLITSYLEEEIFMIALLEEFARQKGVSPFVAFKKMFSSKVKRNFSFQKELVDVFGTEAVRSINNIISTSNLGYAADQKDFKEVAQQCGFYSSYFAFHTKAELGENIKFSGLPGYLEGFDTGS